jgi:hypothetical protein
VDWDSEAVDWDSEAVDWVTETMDWDMGCTPSMKIRVEIRGIAPRAPDNYTIVETGGLVLKFRGVPREMVYGEARIGPDASRSGPRRLERWLRCG